ncbi:DUF4893 domain-containing protein [Dyella sp.]|uniref:DUF4893 domain-containing protein n=1 Tax=Dyella sp. TaxID=1869338 RepID=UPI002ED159BF
MKIRLASIFTLALVAGAAHAQTCDWQDKVQPQDKASTQIAPDSLLGVLADHYDDQEQQQGAELARSLIHKMQSPLPVGNIAGRWRVRSIQASHGSYDFAYAYPYFTARIDANSCGFHFAKTTGSQRHGGQLYTQQGNDERRLIFLGTLVMNNATLLDYGPNNLPSNQPGDGKGAQNAVGQMWRTGPNELLMLVDADDKGFTILQFTR